MKGNPVLLSGFGFPYDSAEYHGHASGIFLLQVMRYGIYTTARSCCFPYALQQQ